MSIKAWLLRAIVVAGLGCKAGGGTASDVGTGCPHTQVPCGNGCIPKLAVCCSPVSTSYCINSAGGGCSDNTDGRCGKTKEFCCAENTNLASYDCPVGQHHCGLACRPSNVGCCARSTDFCSEPPPDSGDHDAADGGKDAGVDAGADAGSDAGSDAGAKPDAATSVGDASFEPPDAAIDNRCCACNFDVYCTIFGAGGCWYCSNSTYDADQNCTAPMGYLTSPGVCMCDPSIYQVCQ